MLAQTLRFPAEAGPLRTGEWVYERKLDGLRCLAVREGARMELWSRNHLPFNRRFPWLTAVLSAVPVESFVLDGEIVAFDGDRTSFQLLQSGQGGEPAFVVFDLLYLLGRETTALPLTDRTGLLEKVLGRAGEGTVRSSTRLSGPPDELMQTACSNGWEGLVAKRATSVYRSGRSPDWRKLKCTARQELVVGGWTDPSGARSGFGALLVGYYADGSLRYAGKVGTGFDEKTLRTLHSTLRSLAVDAPPFENPPPQRGTHWVEPVLVAEVEFTEWTRDGRLRHPAFLGLRDDKAAQSVVRES
jgi:bifunctional non-homologous end joining protein LigD